MKILLKLYGKNTRTLTTITCKALLLAEEYGTTYDEVSAKVTGASSVKASIQRFTLPISELGEYVKCFDCMGVTEISKKRVGLEIILRKEGLSLFFFRQIKSTVQYIIL